MANSKRPRKVYRPRAIRYDITDSIMLGDAQFSEEEKAEIGIMFHGALANLMGGKAAISDWQLLADALNILEIVREKANGGDLVKSIIYNAQDALINIRERYLALNKIGATGDEMKAINSASDIYDAVLESLTKREYMHAVAQINFKIRNHQVIRIERIKHV